MRSIVLIATLATILASQVGPQGLALAAGLGARLPQQADAATGDISPTIVGGTPASTVTYPWTTMLWDRDANAWWGCGGTLVSPRWVLTAAHCVVRGSSTISPSSIGAVLGRDLVSQVTAGDVRPADQVVVHPSYDAAASSYDFALLRLAADAPFVSASLVPATFGTPAGAQTRTLGWGTTSSGGTVSDQLLQVVVPIVSDGTCGSSSSYGSAFIAATMICAGSLSGAVDSCQGDSGGPLVAPAPSNGWQLAGVVSWGYGCAEPNLPGVYARVSSALAWIDGQTGSLAPAVTAVQSPTASGSAFSVVGSGFASGCYVTVGGQATFFDVRSWTQGFAYAAPGLSSGAVRVSCPRASSAANGPTLVIGSSATPTVTDVGPRSGPQGSTFSIVGTSFVAGQCWASIAGNGIYFDARSSSQGFAYVEPSLPIGTSGPVRVHCPGGTSNAGPAFSVTTSTPPPTVSTVSPSSGARGNTFSITGTGFVAGQCWASIDNNPIYLAVVSGTQGTAYVEPSLAVGTSGPVRVHCSSGTSNAGPTYTVTS